MLLISKIINDEKECYGKLFTDLNLDPDLVFEFLSKSEYKQRTYLTRMNILKNYIDLIENIENYNENHKILSYVKLLSNVGNLKKYKKTNYEVLEQLSDCSKCTCLNCTIDCPFRACLGCSTDSYIYKCDKTDMNIRAHMNYQVHLQNNKTKEKASYNVLFTLKNCKDGNMFIVLQSSESIEKLILHYYPNISGDTYGEIKDSKFFDRIVSLLKEEL